MGDVNLRIHCLFEKMMYFDCGVKVIHIVQNAVSHDMSMGSHNGNYACSGLCNVLIEKNVNICCRKQPWPVFDVILRDVIVL